MLQFKVHYVSGYIYQNLHLNPNFYVQACVCVCVHFLTNKVK